MGFPIATGPLVCPNITTTNLEDASEEVADGQHHTQVQSVDGPWSDWWKLSGLIHCHGASNVRISLKDMRREWQLVFSMESSERQWAARFTLTKLG